jgi:hypothetical protein
MFGFFFKTQTSQYSQMLHHRQSPLFHKVPSPSIPQGPNHLNPQAYPQAPQGTPSPSQNHTKKIPKGFWSRCLQNPKRGDHFVQKQR